MWATGWDRVVESARIATWAKNWRRREPAANPATPHPRRSTALASVPAARLIAVAVVPHGTVTFLFTAIEGSTLLWEEQPADMRLALATHDRLIREVVEAHEGYVFSTSGDAFSVASSTPGNAVTAAVAAQRRLDAEPWPNGVALRVRMGIHTGTADERDGDYFGPALNRAARMPSPPPRLRSRKPAPALPRNPRRQRYLRLWSGPASIR
jgi:class 3 adenylate cyclase